MMAFSHFPVAPTKLTIPAEVGLSKKMKYRKMKSETMVIFLEIILFKGISLQLTAEVNEDVNKCKLLKAKQLGLRPSGRGWDGTSQVPQSIEAENLTRMAPNMTSFFVK